jgi:hypothetical protein
VFLDEFAATTKRTRTNCHAPQGARLAKVPRGHWKSNTFVAGLRSTGLVAPLAIDGLLFVGYFTQHLAPPLKPGDVVVLDNLPCHKRRETRRAIEAFGAQLVFFTALYSGPESDRAGISKLK